MIATIENMQKCYDAGMRNGGVGGPRVFAFSPTTDEEYSADPGDYWNAPAGWTLKDSEDKPMILATQHDAIVEVELP